MTEETRQVLDVDVLFVGAGSASLAGALISQSPLLRKHGKWALTHYPGQLSTPAH